MTRKDQRAVVDSVNALNGIHNEQVNDPEISARIAQYELAFKMHLCSRLMDINEPTCSECMGQNQATDPLHQIVY